MSAALDAVAHDALVLSPDERMALAYRLLVSVEPEPGANEAWDAEIGRRMADFNEGKSQTFPASEVFARLREIAPGQ